MHTACSDQYILAGDIGGTKSLLLLAQLDGKRLKPLYQRRYLSAAYADIHTMLDDFCTRAGLSAPPHIACLALAGPVESLEEDDTQAQLTNLPWCLQGSVIAQQSGIAKVVLLNDFAAIAHALDALEEEQHCTLQSGKPPLRGTRLILGAGTGLGVCIVPPGCARQALSTESGHAGFAPADAQQQRLWSYIFAQEGRCTREHVLSGQGIVRIAQFLRTQGESASPALEAALAQSSADPAAVLSEFALQHQERLAYKSLALFARIYGSLAGDLALSCLPFGGVYIAGGIAPKILPLLQEDNRFIQAFADKPPMTHLLTQMPVAVILDTAIGLRGAAHFAANLSRNASGNAELRPT
ncbi:glucokinase [Thiorhodospira sibirica]|uniref:glucokinase n=1 Tax=Thiorhodospira sibirica TaxID=154347 RepID=UPI00022C177E|nr:glucokinase [Thiorhodospira sibirica]